MSRTLGLDLGSNSLGWAVLDDITGEIEHKGVVVFPDGVDLDAKTSLDTKAATRRAKRMGRRMRFRRKLRKLYLLKVLIGAKMCPLTEEELVAWKKTGKFPIGNRAFLDWLRATDKSNPYCDRDAASRGKVSPFVLGRALYHICQRRGFKSSRKEESQLVDVEDGEKIKIDKEAGKVKGGIQSLTREIANAGCETLGQYFFCQQEKERNLLQKSRIRCHYTGRIEHYEVEFNVIMKAQGYVKSDRLFKDLHDAIFWQRPLRSQKHLVGNCPLEPKQPRALIAHPAFEEFRMRVFVNNLSLEDENQEWRDDEGNFLYPLTMADRDAICQKVASIGKATFKSIKPLFKKDPRFVEKKLRFHYYEDDDTIPSCPLRTRIASAFGGVAYNEQMVFDALTYFDDQTKLADWFRKHYPALEEKSVIRLSSTFPKEGNAKYSLKAINRMLPFLRKGFELSHARFCAKLPDVVPDYAAHEEALLIRLEEIAAQHRRERSERARVAQQIRKNLPPLPTLYERYEQCLLSEFNVSPEKWCKLYLHDDSTYAPETFYCPHGKNGPRVELKVPRLPPVNLGMIRNPLVQRSMTTLRRLVNYLAGHGMLTTDDTIRIELARSVNDFATRTAYQKWQKLRAALREQAAADIEKYVKVATEDQIDKYLLACEQGWVCMYTGRTINISSLLSSNDFDVEHTLPRSLSGDDAMVNKTICDSVYNRQVKKGCVPSDCPNWSSSSGGFDPIEGRLRPWREKLVALEADYRKQTKSASRINDPEKRSKARVNALVTRIERDYWREKLRRFDIKIDELSLRSGVGLGFKRRQLVDTGIMCSHAVDFLKCLYPNVYSVNGAATAFARKAWGVQVDGVKDRTEHTHHAKDAMVIAALTPSRFSAICARLKDDGAEQSRECDVCPSPWPDFAERVRKASNEILVKHVMRQTTMRQSHKRNVIAKRHPVGGVVGATMVGAVLSRGDTVRGQLHNDTFYGCIQDPESQKLQKVVRKSLVGPITGTNGCEKFISKIVDPTIRKIVKSAVHGLKTKGVKNIEPGMIKMPSGVPINKVRIFATNATNAKELRNHTIASVKEYKNPYYVTSAEGSNFRMAVFDVGGKRSVAVENSLEWAQNHKRQDYRPNDKKTGFVGYVMPGTMALTYHDGIPKELKNLSPVVLTKRLYKVVKFDNSGRITLRRHVEARASVMLSQDLTAAGKHAAGESKIDFDNPHELLLVSPKAYLSQMLFEGIHFRMMLDGSIKFLN